jgi:integrase
VLVHSLRDLDLGRRLPRPTQWLEGPVRDLRETTQAGYRNAVVQHLLPRFASRCLDDVTADDLATMVRAMRTAGKSEATILVALGVLGRIYKYAGRRLGFTGVNPTTQLLTSERPKVSLAKKRLISTGAQIEQTVAAAHEPYRTLFIGVALTGARLTWADARLDNADEAELTFGWQVDRHGNRRPTKTDGSARTVPITAQLAAVLIRHRERSASVDQEAFVFATRTGRPLGQRNVQRALRTAQARATAIDGEPTFPALHGADHASSAKPLRAVPSMHSFRHTVASRARCSLSNWPGWARFILWRSRRHSCSRRCGSSRQATLDSVWRRQLIRTRLGVLTPSISPPPQSCTAPERFQPC